jgi:hypothetical protein
MGLTWKFDQYLKAHNLTAYAVQKQLGGSSSTLAYEWAKLNAPPQRLHTEALTKVLDALHALTGEPVTVADLLEYQQPPAPTLAQSLDSESQAWLEADLGRLADHDPFVWPDGVVQRGRKVAITTDGLVVRGSKQ